MAFYGQAPHPSGDWQEVPTDALEKYMMMLPRLEAERSLSRIQETAAAFGSLEERDQRRYVRQLQLAASGGRSSGVEKASVASLAQMGITVEGG